MEDRKQFFSRFASISRKERVMVELAYALAKHAHRWQERQETDHSGSPMRYFEHPRRTALIAIDELGFSDWELLCTLLLHDVVEDTDYITAEHLSEWFTPRVAECVTLLSKLPKAGYEERLLGCGEWRALVAKGCDRLDNLRSLGSCELEKQERKLEETVSLYYPIFERMMEIIPSVHFAKARKLFDLIKVEVNRFSAPLL